LLIFFRATLLFVILSLYLQNFRIVLLIAIVYFSYTHTGNFIKVYNVKNIELIYFMCYNLVKKFHLILKSTLDESKNEN